MAHRFSIGDHIGSGGFGTVDKATRVDSDGNGTGEQLARKQLLDRYINDAEAVSRFKREVRLLDEMDHPNVLPVVGRNLTDSPPWFVMPYAERTLASEIAAGRGSDRDWVVKTFSGILAGMAYAHSERRILHRDLKPENVLMIEDVPKVADFGLGKRLDPNTVDLTSANIGMGTMAYMAPEQFTDAATVGPPADVYSLGKILGEMLTGTRPIVGRPRLEAFPDEYRSFIDKCTADAPEDRYANAADALAAFQLMVSGSGATGTVSGADLEGQLKLWENTPKGEDEEEIAAIAATLVNRRNDEELYFRAVPRLPTLLVRQLIELRPGDFDIILRSYNNHIQGGLPFEYCDVVANFYRDVFRETEELAHRRLILERLFDLGYSHNRWHVGNVFANLLVEIDDQPTIDAAAEVIASDPVQAHWYRDYVANRSIDSKIMAAFRARHETEPW